MWLTQFYSMPLAGRCREKCNKGAGRAWELREGVLSLSITAGTMSHSCNCSGELYLQRYLSSQTASAERETEILQNCKGREEQESMRTKRKERKKSF